MIALIILILVNSQNKNILFKISKDILVIFSLIVIHQLLFYASENLFLIRKSYNSFYQFMFNNPLVWLDIVMIILFYLGFYLIKYKNQLKENELISYQLKEKLSLARLQELKSKINPSFLYKSLEKISELVKDRQTSQADNLLTAISDFLRISLYNEKDFISLKDEIDIVEKYLSVERIISKKKIELKNKIDNSLYEFMISSFSILFIVKNLLNIISQDICVELTAKETNNELFIVLNIFFNAGIEYEEIKMLHNFIKENDNVYLIENGNSYSIILSTKKILKMEQVIA
ncbi:MAG: histidine kinase [Melioribacter sp.]|uniref:histidine kinase n=1 Tax=Rosettibacter primus TaxID=3111523 RepID=UPI00247D5F40|nr:histidine kinase [Melioribacter sp.]